MKTEKEEKKLCWHKYIRCFDAGTGDLWECDNCKKIMTNEEIEEDRNKFNHKSK